MQHSVSSAGGGPVRERLTLAILFATWGLVFLDRMSVLYLAPYIARDLHLDDAQVGMLAGVVAVSWAVSALLFGALSDRVGRKVVLVPMVLLFSIVSALSGFAHSYVQLLWLRILLGVLEGPCWSVLMALVEDNSAPAHRGRNIGIVVSAAALIGLAVAPVLTTQVAAAAGWRDAFFIAAAPGVVLAGLIAVCVRESAELKARSSARRAWRRDIVQMLRYPNLWASACGAAGFMSWLFLVNAFGPLYITTVLHQSGTTAGFLMGAAGLGSFLIGLVAPAISDRAGRRLTLIVCAALSIVLPLALLLRVSALHLWLLAGVLFCTQTGQALSAICIVLVPTESVPRHLAATAIGFATLFGELIGGFAAPLVAGSLAQQHGLAVPLWMAAGGGLIVLLAAIALRPVAPASDAAQVAGP